MGGRASEVTSRADLRAPPPFDAVIVITDVWIPLLESKAATADVTSASDLADLLQLHEQSVEGYLCQFNASLPPVRSRAPS